MVRVLPHASLRAFPPSLFIVGMETEPRALHSLDQLHPQSQGDSLRQLFISYAYLDRNYHQSHWLIN